MTNVIHLDFDANKPHATGKARCWKCDKEWQAVWPLPAPKHLECDCGALNHVPPTTWDEAIAVAVEALHGAAAEAAVAANEMSELGKPEAAGQFMRWSKAKKNAATILSDFAANRQDIDGAFSDEIDRHNRAITENAELRRMLTASEDEACKGWAEADKLRLEVKTLQGRLHILQQDFEGRGDALTREVNRKLDAQEDNENLRAALQRIADAGVTFYSEIARKALEGATETVVYEPYPGAFGETISGDAMGVTRNDA